MSESNIRLIGTITVMEQRVEGGFVVSIHSADMPFIIDDVSDALFRFNALIGFGRQLTEVGRAWGFKAAQDEIAEISAQMEALEAKWNACTEDHKGRSTDRPCPACGFGG